MARARTTAVSEDAQRHAARVRMLSVELDAALVRVNEIAALRREAMAATLAAGMTQAELARFLHVGEGTVSRMRRRSSGGG